MKFISFVLFYLKCLFTTKSEFLRKQSKTEVTTLAVQAKAVNFVATAKSNRRKIYQSRGINVTCITVTAVSSYFSAYYN